MRKFLPFLAAILIFGHTAWGQTNEKADQSDTAKKRPLITNERYAAVGLGYTAGLSENSPYKGGINWHSVVGFPVLNRRVVVEGQVDFDFRFTPSRDWNTRAYGGWRPSKFRSSLDGFISDFTLGAYPVVVNKENFSVLAGPMVGVAFITARSASGDIFMRTGPFGVELCYGLNASVFIGRHAMLSAQYFMTPITKVDAGTPDFPVTFNALRVSVSYYRGPSKWVQERKARKAQKKAVATASGSSQ